MTSGRVGTLWGKEILDLRRNRAVLLPVAVVALITLVLPFAIAVLIPAATGHRLDEDPDLVKVSRVAVPHEQLPAESQIQVFLFQQFLLVFLLIPITGAMALAAHAVVGEKQARTLEPLLATPITTTELLIAKVLGAVVPTLAISGVGLVLFFGCIAWLGAPGVFGAMLSPRTAILVGLVGPAAALVSVQAAVLISSRVNDARTAQQFAVLIVVPLMVILVAQFTGTLWLSTRALALVAVGLCGVWIVLMLASVRLFDRETILTRWR
jgi:ABC-2 type transport system permease protein